jgi:mRNA interferase RelE/StbE
MDVRYTKSSLKTLMRMPANTARLIQEKIQQYARDPASLANNVKKLQGREGEYRLRTGDWRVIFSQDGIVLTIWKVSPRGRAYED